MNIGEYLIANNKVTLSQLEDAVLTQKFTEKRIGEILIEKGYVGEDDIARYLSRTFNHEYFENFHDRFIEINKNENEELGFKFLYEIPAILIKKDLKNFIICNGITSLLSERMAFDPLLKGAGIGISSKSKIYEALNRTFINKSGNLCSEKDFLNEAVEMALLKNSSNVRIKRSEDHYLIIIDADSGQETLRAINLDQGQRIINIIAANCQVTLKKGEGQDAKFIFSSNIYKGLKVNIRVAFLPISSKIDKEFILFEAVLRVHGFNKITDLKSAGITQGKVEILKKLYTYPDGFIVSTGPTGSGKTTTFYALLKLLAQKKKSIITIEDPVEIELKESNITQMSISSEFGYPEALRVILRSEPKIIMVGEIRDEITATHSLIAAETGHLVLATLHTNSSLSIFSRLKSLKIDPFHFFSLIRMSTSQRLYNPLCPECRKKVPVDSLQPFYRLSLEETFSSLEYGAINNGNHGRLDFKLENAGMGIEYVYVRGETPCDYCGGKGYIEKKPLIEIAEFNNAVKERIYKDPELLLNYSDLERVLMDLSNFEPLRIQAMAALTGGEIDPSTYFNLSR